MSRTPRMFALALATGLLAPLALVAAASPPAAEADETVDLTFPVAGEVDYSDTFHASRSGGRTHHATDLGGPDTAGVPVHAAVGGTIEWITGEDGNPPSYGYMVRISGDDGRDYSYVHLGEQHGPPSEAYAPGIADGARVERGQHLGYIGSSGNASADWPHLHFEIHEGKQTLNPYPSLVAAEERGDVPGATRFLDVMASATHAEAILAIADAGISQGCDDRRFCPTKAVTRGQMATFLARAVDAPAAGEHHFDDVPTDHPHAEGINRVTEAQIASGNADGEFRPDAPVRRDQMATLLANALGLEDAGTPPFDDVPEESVHAGSIAALAEAGIANGRSDSVYEPRTSIVRGQMASFLQRSFLS